MDRLNQRANAAGWLQHKNEKAEDQEQARDRAAVRMAEAFDKAKLIAMHLAPLSALVAKQTESNEGMQIWAEAWARQILAARLTDQEIARGKGEVMKLIASLGHPPLNFSHFLSACRPDAHLTGQDHEARKAHPFLLTRDLNQDKGWCAARDAALAKLRKMGY